MPSKPPLILVHNVFDRINLYPTALLTADTPIVGREVQYLADYRRERSYYEAAVAAVNREVRVDLGVGNTAIVDAVWIDRGHNLWGTDINIEASDDNFASTLNSAGGVAPAQGTVGGDPTTGWSVTEEGALYRLFAAFPGRRYFRVRSASNIAPRITGVVLGKRSQLLGYSSVVDEDAGERFERSEQSLIPGYAGSDRTYSARKIELRLSLIGATEYDSTTRLLRRLLFDINQPFVACTNYGTKPERTWLYKYQGSSWSSPVSRSSRSVTITAYEYGPLIR